MVSQFGLARRTWLLSSAAIIALTCLVASGARAQDIEPRKWSDTPVGVNFLILGYAYTQGGIAFDPSLPINNPHLETNSGGLGLARSLDLWGFSGKFSATVPYTWLSGSADYLGRPVQRTVNGFGNPEFELSVNLYGAPAMGMKDFASYQQDWIVGVALKVSAPAGQYDDTRLVNISTNRWFLQTEPRCIEGRRPVDIGDDGGRHVLHGQHRFLRRLGAIAGSDLFASRARHPQFSLRDLGLSGRHVLRGRAIDDQWGGEQRSAAELARRRNACAPRQ